MTSDVMNSDTQSSHYSGSANGPWNKIMTLMEKAMATMKIGSLVMAFRTSCVVEEMRGGAGAGWRGTGGDMFVGPWTEVPGSCYHTRPSG